MSVPGITNDMVGMFERVETETTEDEPKYMDFGIFLGETSISVPSAGRNSFMPHAVMRKFFNGNFARNSLMVSIVVGYAICVIIL